jgi:hypothetical protein
MLVASSLDAGPGLEFHFEFLVFLYFLLLGCISSQSQPQGSAGFSPAFLFSISIA